MTTTKANIFGDVRAEQDHNMLDSSFYESQNYRTLFESQDRFIVVGRRGTGKSALTYRLSKEWLAQRNITLVIAPAEEQVIGLRPIASLFGESLTHIRAGIKLAWRYSLLLEIALLCQTHYKTASEVTKYQTLNAHLKAWSQKGGCIFERLRATLREPLKGIAAAEDRIADLPAMLQINKITEEVTNLAKSLKQNIVLLIDRLDEGYEPDKIGTGIVDGILYGTDDVRSTLAERIRAIVFLRDNIFRAVQTGDQDFSRNLESQVLRLHWDPEELFYFVCKRIRAAFKIERESDVKVWNGITSLELHGREGFRRCLRLTLYRPRDVIALLNAAIEQARRHDRSTLIDQDFSESAKLISSTRFDDLGKEYESVFPGIRILTSSFANGPAKMSLAEAIKQINKAVESQTFDANALQHFRILGSEEEIAKGLYGVGFFGLLEKQSNTWVFSHDGKQPDKALQPDHSLMIHPCYWSALGLQKDDIDATTAEQIFDEYEITIHSQSAEQRASSLGRIISELSTIPSGAEGATQFEDWCKRVIEIAFAKELTNIELHPNQAAVQRRDIVATNQGTRGFWKRIRDDYDTRQLIFEVKNYEDIGIEEYRQVNGYLCREYGKMGFIICRDRTEGLIRGRDLEAFREFYIQGKVIIKITSSTLTGILSKLRSPSKIDVGDIALGRILDTHIRLYASGQTERTERRRRVKP